MRMAAHYGRTVEDLGSSMSSAELTRWLAFEQEYGFPDAYFVVARLGAVIEGSMTGKPRAAEAYAPYFRTPPRPQTAAEQQAIVRAHLAAARRKSTRV